MECWVSQPTAFGIDLGTTFSLVAQVSAPGIAAVLPNAEGAPTTPSVVLFDGNDVVVGAIAREALAIEPESVVQLVKRQMGSQWLFEYRGITYRAEHISALILRKLIQDARLLGEQATQAVITVPAYFNDAMRLATRTAGEIAGIEVIGLLSEPTAAAIAFGYDKRPDHVSGIVIDLGGGTFDVTVMDYEGPELLVRATGGDNYLGGANFDKVLFDYFVDDFARTQGLDLNDPSALSIEEFAQVSHDWLLRATRAKHDLTSRERTTVALQAAGFTRRLDISREKFIELSRVLLDEMSEKMLDVVRSSGLRPSDMGVVLAVGGATRAPMVRARIKDLFGIDPEPSVRPDEAVAIGAALFAAQRQLEAGHALVIGGDARRYLDELTVTDVASHSIGISVYDAAAAAGGRPVMSVILPKNASLPFADSRTFFTMHENETRIVVPVLEGEELDPGLGIRIGEVVVDDLPSDRRANQPVQITMTYDRDGILEVSAKDVDTGTEASTTIERSGLAASVVADPAADAVRRAKIQ